MLDRAKGARLRGGAVPVSVGCPFGAVTGRSEWLPRLPACAENLRLRALRDLRGDIAADCGVFQNLDALAALNRQRDLFAGRQRARVPDHRFPADRAAL